MPRKPNRVAVTCAYDGETTYKQPSQVERSATGLFFHYRKCKSAYFAQLFRKPENAPMPCAREGCSELAIPPNRYHDRKCAGLTRQVDKVTLDCAGGCGRTFTYWPSTVPKTGRAVCKECRGNGVNTKPRKGEEDVPCALGPECLRADEDGEPGKFYRAPGDDQECCSTGCANKARSRKVTITCEVCGGPKELSPALAAHNASRYCGRWCMGLGQIKRRLPDEFNGKPKVLDKEGYVRIWLGADDPRRPGWCYEHIYVDEQAHGPLPEGWEVHHEDEVKDNNVPSNLTRMAKEDHGRIHGQRKWLQKSEVAKRLKALDEYKRRFGPLPEA